VRSDPLRNVLRALCKDPCIPEKLLGLFERTAWPVVPASAAARAASQGPKLDIGARMRGMWR
jgi:DNA helicase II / ATP-dependent DNA helicase PcrA